MNDQPKPVPKDYWRYRVLVAEDDTQAAKLIKMVLDKLGFEQVDMAVDGNEAWDFVDNATQPYHLIISDWNMLGITGLELLKNVRKRYPSLPFIMITGRGKLESAIEAKKNDVTWFINKPYGPRQLIEKIDVIFDEK
ncbi:response regulator [Magnetovibrio sp. PR-2]|uniref:response regulator n=1 Tax=Magnetovibrio sp. PR-2 TaxID=3120356 RepID=UPI002FCE0779